MENRAVFLQDPTTTSIPNHGVAQVGEPRTPEEWEVLRHELSSFVCEGAYDEGLERVLRTYLENFGESQQPAVWVSGFYGSGKSHFSRVLEYLWRDVVFTDDGASARSLVKVTPEITAHLVELNTRARQAGGMWAAAGKMGAGSGDSVRLALLGIMFRAAGLPELYPAARFTLWLHGSGYQDAVNEALRQRGRSLEAELVNLWVSPHLAEAVLQADPGFAESPAHAKELFRTQFPRPTDIADISDEEFIQTVEALLSLVGGRGEIPCTLLVLDELQQWIGDDPARALAVQTVVETCMARFRGRLLVVATGQAQLEATPQLEKLRGRFKVRVTLSDADVEKVVRKVVLQKAPDKEPLLAVVLDKASGEINRHLAGTQMGARPGERMELLADYPLLPVRRRFWEAVLHAVDSAGMAGQLRTQLSVVHEATRRVALAPLGTVVPGDLIYDQLRADMQQRGVLSRDIMAEIDDLEKDGGEDGRLRARLCALIFMIGRLPTQAFADTGVRATAEVLADLLVEDLTADSGPLRDRVPELLSDLVESAKLMLLNGEYRLQTRDSAEWENDYRKLLARRMVDAQLLNAKRVDAIEAATKKALKGLSVQQGTRKEHRVLHIHVGTAGPQAPAGAVVVWVRDEWTTPERVVRLDAQQAGAEDATVWVFVPRSGPEQFRTALASREAANDTIVNRPPPASDTGKEARAAMYSRLQSEESTITDLADQAVRSGRVFLSGGHEVTGGTELAFREAVRQAADAAQARLFPRYHLADQIGWDKVISRAIAGREDPLEAVQHTGGPEAHPACQLISAFVGNGKKGAEVRRRFEGVGFGWPRDAVDGALLAVLAGGQMRASRNGQTLTVRQMSQQIIPVAEFAVETHVISVQQRLAVRRLLQDAGLGDVSLGDSDAATELLRRLIGLAAAAGGDAPLPPPPNAAHVMSLQVLAGTQQLLGIYEARAQLLEEFRNWTAIRDRIILRQPRWIELKRLLTHAGTIPEAAQIRRQVEAIEAGRSLLVDPDPVVPIHAALAGLVRRELTAVHRVLAETVDREAGILKNSEPWTRLNSDRRQRVLADFGLDAIAPLDIGTDVAMLTTLDRTPLADWAEKSDAVPTRAAQARASIAREFAPTAVSFAVPPATLSSEPEVDVYLAALRSAILVHIAAGNPVSI